MLTYCIKRNGCRMDEYLHLSIKYTLLNFVRVDVEVTVPRQVGTQESYDRYCKEKTKQNRETT